MTRRLRKFVALPAPDLALLLEAAVVLAAVRLALWMLPFRTLRRLMTPRPTPHNPYPTTRIAWAIEAIAPTIPKSTCLVRALAGQFVLARRGISSNLRIGVAKSPTFQAHAWLEYNGAPLLGGAGLDRYTPFSANL